MNLIIAFITILGLLTAVYAFFKVSKAYGTVQFVLAVVCPVIIKLFCSLKYVRAFGGTDWEFLWHSATIDGDLWSWVVFAILISLVILVLKTIFIALKNSGENK